MNQTTWYFSFLSNNMKERKKPDTEVHKKSLSDSRKMVVTAAWFLFSLKPHVKVSSNQTANPEIH